MAKKGKYWNWSQDLLEQELSSRGIKFSDLKGLAKPDKLAAMRGRLEKDDENETEKATQQRDDDIVITDTWVSNNYNDDDVRRVAKALGLPHYMDRSVRYVKKLIHGEIKKANNKGEEIRLNLDELPELKKPTAPLVEFEEPQTPDHEVFYPIGTEVSFEHGGKVYSGKVSDGPDPRDFYVIETDGYGKATVHSSILYMELPEPEIEDGDTRPIDLTKSEPEPEAEVAEGEEGDNKRTGGWLSELESNLEKRGWKL